MDFRNECFFTNGGCISVVFDADLDLKPLIETSVRGKYQEAPGDYDCLVTFRWAGVNSDYSDIFRISQVFNGSARFVTNERNELWEELVRLHPWLVGYIRPRTTPIKLQAAVRVIRRLRHALLH